MVNWHCFYAFSFGYVFQNWLSIDYISFYIVYIQLQRLIYNFCAKQLFNIYKINYSYKRILVLISHSQDFLNGVCTNIIHINKKRLKYYTGNYDAFVKTRLELLENQMKQYNWEQDQINHMKVDIKLQYIS